MAKAFLVALLVAGPALAQASVDEKAAARRHFEAGLSHAQQADLQGALAAFEAAYASSPHYSVLYNMAQTQAALGRAVEAIATFERYLAEGGAEISSARRDEVQVRIAAYRKHIGVLRIDANSETRVWLDGAELRPEQLNQDIRLSAGTHRLIHASGSGFPATQEVTVSGESTTRVPLAAAAPPLDAQLEIACKVPGAVVVIDGQAGGRTPIARPLLIASGERRLTFSRPGYHPIERSVRVAARAFAKVDCALRPELEASPDVLARLVISARPSDARVLVDGEAFVGPSLPAGPHDVVVEHQGYLRYQKTLSVDARKLTRLDIALVPTATTLARDERARSQKRTLAYVLGGSGAALALAGGGIFIWNQTRYEDLQRAAARSSMNPDPNRVVSIQRIDDLAVGMIAAGTGLLIGGLWTHFTSSPEP